MEVDAQQLRDLVFEAESQHRAALLGPGGDAAAAAARGALLQLQCFLSARGAQSPALAQQVASLLEDCSSRLASLRVHESRAESRCVPAWLLQLAVCSPIQAGWPHAEQRCAALLLRCAGRRAWAACWPRPAAQRASSSATRG